MHPHALANSRAPSGCRNRHASASPGQLPRPIWVSPPPGIRTPRPTPAPHLGVATVEYPHALANSRAPSRCRDRRASHGPPPPPTFLCVRVVFTGRKPPRPAAQRPVFGGRPPGPPPAARTLRPHVQSHSSRGRRRSRPAAGRPRCRPFGPAGRSPRPGGPAVRGPPPTHPPGRQGQNLSGWWLPPRLLRNARPPVGSEPARHSLFASGGPAGPETPMVGRAKAFAACGRRLEARPPPTSSGPSGKVSAGGPRYRSRSARLRGRRAARNSGLSLAGLASAPAPRPCAPVRLPTRYGPPGPALRRTDPASSLALAAPGRSGSAPAREGLRSGPGSRPLRAALGSLSLAAPS